MPLELPGGTSGKLLAEGLCITFLSIYQKKMLLKGHQKSRVTTLVLCIYCWYLLLSASVSMWGFCNCYMVIITALSLIPICFYNIIACSALPSLFVSTVYQDLIFWDVRPLRHIRTLVTATILGLLFKLFPVMGTFDSSHLRWLLVWILQRFWLPMWMLIVE